MQTKITYLVVFFSLLLTCVGDASKANEPIDQSKKALGAKQGTLVYTIH